MTSTKSPSAAMAVPASTYAWQTASSGPAPHSHLVSPHGALIWNKFSDIAKDLDHPAYKLFLWVRGFIKGQKVVKLSEKRQDDASRHIVQRCATNTVLATG